ncbi:MAG: S26 family signal peptidase [Methanobacteriota archaeon]
MNLQTIKTMFLRFWRSENEKIAILRDVLVALLAVFIVLLGLWTYTGQWFSAPMVAIESGSMEHPDSGFGRLGVIDAGDMVLVQKVYQQRDLIPYKNAENTNDANAYTYSNWGDVIIYRPLGRTDASQIIHRCMCWVEVYQSDDITTYTITAYGIHNSTSVTIPELGLYNFPPRRDLAWTNSGYLTKGDNNNVVDQATNICPEPVKLEWISGKARSEIPWIGTINLFFEDILHGRDTVKNVHQDSLICLAIVITVLISVPIVWDVHDYLKDKKKTKINP